MAGFPEARSADRLAEIDRACAQSASPEWFELLEIDLLLEDPEQVVLTLRRQ